jgi:hypothetical protein
MASLINATKPEHGSPLSSEEMRANFAAAKAEIEALQSAPPAVPSLDFSALGNMRFGGDAGVAEEGPVLTFLLGALENAAIQTLGVLRGGASASANCLVACPPSDSVRVVVVEEAPPPGDQLLGVLYVVAPSV